MKRIIKIGDAEIGLERRDQEPNGQVGMYVGNATASIHLILTRKQLETLGQAFVAYAGQTS